MGELRFDGVIISVQIKYIENAFQAIQSTFRSLEMQYKRGYEICTCSVILEELSLPIYKGFSIIFPKIVDVI